MLVRPAITFAALFALPAAHAGVFGEMSVVAPAPAGERKYDAGTLRPVDLKSCVVDAYSIDTADALFAAARPKVEEERAELQRLQQAAAGKGPGDPASTQLRAKARAFNARVAALNGQVEYAQAARDRFSKVCKGRSYHAADLEAIRGGLPPEIAAIVPGR